MPKLSRELRTRLFRSRDESAFEFRRGFAGFRHVYAKRDSRFSFLGELSSERGESAGLRPHTRRPNRFAHRPQKTDRALRNDNVRRRLIEFHPEKSVTGQCRHGIDTSAKRRPEMIRVQRHGCFDRETVFVARDHAQSHRARDRDLLVKKFFRVAEHGATSPILSAIVPARSSTAPRWCGSHARASCRSTESPPRALS